MNKILKIVMFILLMFLIFFIQFYVIDSKTLFGIKPNLILILVITASIYFRFEKGLLFALNIGVILDFIYSFNNFGIYTLTYTLIALVIIYIKEKYIKINIASTIYLTIIGSAVFEVIQYFTLLFGYGVNIGIFRMIFGIILFVILNCAVGIIIYNVFNKIFQKDSTNVYF